jgi:hypothetical protein
MHPITCLELELVEAVALGETPGRLEVTAQVLDLRDGGKKGRVDRLPRCQPAITALKAPMRCGTHLLLRLLLLGERLLLLALAKELALLGGLGRLGLGEVGVVDRLGDGDASDVDLGRGRDNVRLAHTTQRDTVEPESKRQHSDVHKIRGSGSLEGTVDEQETRVELLEENDSLAAETSGKEDEDGTGRDAGSEGGLASRLARDLGLADILGGVVFGGLGGRHKTLLSVGLAANSLLGVRGLLRLGRGGGGLLACTSPSTTIHTHAFHRPPLPEPPVTRRILP